MADGGVPIAAAAPELEPPPVTASGPSRTDREIAVPTHDEIAALAYSFWEARGRQGGSPSDDWLRAEQELRQRQAG